MRFLGWGRFGRVWVLFVVVGESRMLYWANPPADQRIVDRMIAELPPESVSIEYFLDRTEVTYTATGELGLDDVMAAFRAAFEQEMGRELETEES